ncbi:MAG TPA: toast rack family protein [Anaerolineales bacterium]|jgi:hypothetical protein
MYKKALLAILALAMASLACGFQTNFPTPVVKSPGKEIRQDISVNFPAGAASLELTFGAGEMTLASGAEHFVDGTAKYNIPDLKPEIKTEGGKVSITQGNYKMNGIPVLNNIQNEWDFKLSKTPMDLTIKAGAYKGHYDFGGLALTNLSVSDGAAEVTADFSSKNLEKMNILSYTTGASNVTLKNLANANFSTLIFESGAGNYKLDFGGMLQRDGSATIRSGVSNLTLVIPASMAATVKVGGGLSNVQFPSGWDKNDDIYTQKGSGPMLTIVVEMGAGNVQITQ